MHSGLPIGADAALPDRAMSSWTYILTGYDPATD